MRNKIYLLLLLALMAAPVATSWSMQLFSWGIPQSDQAQGQLLPDRPPLQEWPLAWQPDGHWWLVMAEVEGCGARCSEQADKLWRIHRALGRDADRVLRLRAGQQTASLPGEVALDWQATPPAGIQPGQTWVVDPEGRVVLTYAADVSPEKIHTDLLHLLKFNPAREI
ncbi:hypothetical protein [Marinospirillum perlucidum]|uniref:hypothetical protein n=1 Tax=Marinospirillum perlucidum TaxID=1982602 RepID=UPI000DF23B5E|nr:hypothetical protein [Marinospirillum perlucidum]